MLKAACYIRVSTDDQLEFSPEAQRRALLNYAEKNDIIVHEHNIFVDEGISGRKAEKRPAFLEMIAQSKQTPRPFDFILVHKFDRFARNREDSVVYKSLLKKECGIRVVSITEQLEDDKFSIILESMLEAMAEYYSLNLADEVKKGMSEKARRGEHIGRVPFGYRLCHKKLLPYQQEIEIVKKIYLLFGQEGKSISYIVNYLNESGIVSKYGSKWRKSTLVYLLQNPVYVGNTRYNYKPSGTAKINPPESWIVAFDCHEAAVDRELFDSVQSRLKNSSFEKKLYSTKLKSWCQGIAVCESCNSPLTLSTSQNGRYATFRCSHCKQSKSWSARQIEALVEQKMLTELKGNKKYNLVKKTAKPDLTQKERLLAQLKKIEIKMQLLKKAYIEQIDTIEEYQLGKEKLLLQKKTIEEKTLALSQQSASQENITTNIENIGLLFCKNLSNEEKNSLATQFIHEIRVCTKDKLLQLFYYV